MSKIALLPGGFKPPHAGHYNMAKWLVANTDADTVLVRVGSKERDNITREMSLALWDLYTQDDDSIIVKASDSNSPVRDVYDYIEQEAPEDSTVYLGMGEKDINDQRFNNIGKFAEPKNIEFETVLVPPQAGGVSGTEMRGFINNDDKESFQKYLPDHIDKNKAWDIVTSNLKEDFYDPRNKYYDFAKSNVPGPKDDIPLNKYLRTPRQSKPLTYETRGGESEMHIYDFDETIARAETPIPYEVKSPEGEVIESGETTSVKFEKTKEELENEYDEGIVIDYNFDAFKKLIGDATLNNPVFQKLLDSLKNPNAKVTILTARSVGLPVTQFLKEQGIWAYVVPLGLEIDGAVTGQDKANWIEKRIKETTKKVIFIDDADENREAVNVLSQKYSNIEFDIQDPPKIEDEENVDEMMMGMMTEPEKKKHAKNLKRLKKYTDKQGNRYAPVPDFIKGTLKRKLHEVQAGTGEIYVYENKYYIDNSDIQGIGAFADNDYSAGTVMGKLHDMPNGIGKGGRDYNFYELGKSYNHSDTPNCENLLHNNTRYLVTIQPIQKGEELTADYRLQPELEQPRHFLENQKINESKMSDINLEKRKGGYNEEYLEILNRFPEDLQREIIDERPNGSQEDIDELKGWYLVKNKPYNISLSELLGKEENMEAIERTPKEVIDKINTDWGLNVKPGKVYDPNPDRYFKYANEFSGDTAKPSIMVNGEVVWGMARFISSLLRGDKTIKVWDIENKMEENVFTKRWWKKIIKEQILKEGGAAGHMNHPFDDRALTFGEMKELIKLSLQGNLDIEEAVTEKTDGQNIAVTYKSGKVGAARNKATIREPMDIDAVAAKFEGRGDIKDAFVNSMKDLENALKELDEDTLNDVFQNGTRFLNMEIIYPQTKNVITYGPQAYLQFHGLDEFNLESASKVESYGVPDSLKSITQDVNSRTQDTFEIIPPKIVKTQELPDFDEKESYYIEQVTKLQQEFDLNDDDKVIMFHQKWWEANIDEYFPNTTEEEKEALVKRWAYFEKGFRLRNISDEETRQKAIEYDKNDFKQQNKENVYHFEKIFLELGADVLANIDGFLAANPDESVQELRKDIQTVQKQVEESGDLEVLKKLEHQLKRIEDIGGFDKLVPSEGIVFVYNGKTYKLTGLFAPVNQLIGLTKYV